MPVLPSDLLDLALELAGTDVEVRNRAAASRAYYAAYHGCLPIGGRFPATSPARGVHARLIRAFRNFRGEDHALAQRVRSVGELLNQARDLRVDADYRLHGPFGAQRARLLIGLAKEILRSVGEIERNLSQ
jgi:uncharacterized protein (UPF0332 family)